MRLALAIVGTLLALLLTACAVAVVSLTISDHPVIAIPTGVAVFWLAGVLGHLSLDLVGADEPYWRS